MYIRLDKLEAQGVKVELSDDVLSITGQHEWPQMAHECIQKLEVTLGLSGHDADSINEYIHQLQVIAAIKNASE